MAALLARERVIDGIRAFFKARHFREVETPLLVGAPGMEPHLEVFETELRTASGTRRRAFLTTSPEYAMKKLLAARLGRIFQICKSFRNLEETSRYHNPEFTILEWYRADTTYFDLLDDCEGLIRELAGCDRLVYQGRSIDFTPPWPRLTVAEAFAQFAEVDLDDDLIASAARRGYTVDAMTTWEQAYHQIFLNEVEPRFPPDRPLFLYDYPASMAALARLNSASPPRAERFELYIAGIELANAFGELTDAHEQRARLEREREERRMGGRVVYDIDNEFIVALEAGIPPSAGIALGIDRLVMLMADAASIRDVLWFPADEIFRLRSDE
ncbi:MAG: EF-P lysine aminoacylase GenX [Chloroflexota bacterium]|nr:MAG: EF-P lysine aminoacylase GenX [Chloroflexota bacterium]